jgi:hypothetical protein
MSIPFLSTPSWDFIIKSFTRFPPPQAESVLESLIPLVPLAILVSIVGVFLVGIMFLIYFPAMTIVKWASKEEKNGDSDWKECKDHRCVSTCHLGKVNQGKKTS